MFHKMVFAKDNSGQNQFKHGTVKQRDGKPDVGKKQSGKQHFVTEKRRQDGGCNQTAAGGRKPAGFLFGHADDHELVDFGLPQVERGGNRGREKAFPEREGLFL